MSAVGAPGGSRRPGGIPFLDDSSDEESGIYSKKKKFCHEFPVNSKKSWYTIVMCYSDI